MIANGTVASLADNDEAVEPPAYAIATGVMYWRRPREHAETRITALRSRSGA